MPDDVFPPSFKDTHPLSEAIKLIGWFVEQVPSVECQERVDKIKGILNEQIMDDYGQYYNGDFVHGAE